MAGMTHTQDILNFASAAHTLPSQVRADAERLLADTLAGGAAGAVSPEAVKLLEAIKGWGGGGEARLLSGGMTSAPSAAFFNGYAIHCLEWDAVHEPAVVHAMSVVTAALLAASDRMGGCSPERFLIALSLGVDIAAGLGLSATGPMCFFRPATAGVIGAALAVARLEMVGHLAMGNVLGLAYSFASGTMQAHVEAADALPIQIGQAARSAITAVDVAKAGLFAPRDVIEGQFGYTSLIEPLDLSRYTSTLGQVWRISEVSIKPFPSGRASHGVLGELQELQRSVDRIEVYVPPLINRLVGRRMSKDMHPAHARLCLPFLIALMLNEGRIDPRRFTPGTFADPDLKALADKVTVTVDKNPDENALSPQRLVMTLNNGQVIERAITANLGSPDAPMSPAQSAAKYNLCRELAPNCDPRIFDDPLSYATDPR
jgi:2-methylcitrate dehydratase PrpD